MSGQPARNRGWECARRIVSRVAQVRRSVPCLPRPLVARARRLARPATRAPQAPALAARRRRAARDARALARRARSPAAGDGRDRERVQRRRGDLSRSAGARRARQARARPGSSTVRFIAANDYYVDIPTEDFADYDAILAMEADGKPLSRRDKGPLWLMYPISDHAELQRSDLPAPADLAGRPDRGAVTDSCRPDRRATSGSSSCWRWRDSRRSASSRSAGTSRTCGSSARTTPSGRPRRWRSSCCGSG